jgi:hypothetical protein
MAGLNRYKYSGHSVLMGLHKCDWQDNRYVLSYFRESVFLLLGGARARRGRGSDGEAIKLVPRDEG